MGGDGGRDLCKTRRAQAGEQQQRGEALQHDMSPVAYGHGTGPTFPQGVRGGRARQGCSASLAIRHPAANAASLAQKFLLTEIPNMRGVMIVALSSILPVTGLNSPATGT